ncbi:MAG TPA: tRNA pseudouridine(55) synthase TruB [Candidatus Desulfovibrio intestinipullorum]|uniref:tRNA pseudouridine synthase B n=1 Tax=Candidatus Desulfovibrio intestinipullorum TaxID=2838536 RepID=A0A9D1PY44_9BACT|nr:tRNA pseudouridine(55) synthase TruB [Candidatus Desulfovibrio intestinipullorum]
MIFSETTTTVAQQHGVLVLNKPSGPTSNRCLTAIKRLGQKKIGHAGTLDPMADGVLLLLLGQATKLSGFLLQSGCKIYDATVLLGRETSTWDAEGEIVQERPWEHVTASMVSEVLNSWQGDLEQIVPPYSAAKSNGQPLYRLARAGKDVPVKIKTVHIFQTEILSLDLPVVRFRVTCSSGTYIRSLAHSLGMRLLCGATLTKLTREYSHPFALSQAADLDELIRNPQSLPEQVHSIEEALPDWPVVSVNSETARRIRNGMPIACPADLTGAEQVLLKSDREILALARVSMDTTQGRMRPVLTVARGLWS